MGIFNADLSPFVAAASLAGGWFGLYHAARHAPWQRLNANGAFSAWCVFIICLPILWSFNVPVERGITLQLLGMPLFVLMFGRQLATVGLGIAVIAYTILQGGAWHNLGMNLILMAVLPPWCVQAVMQLIYRFLPRHLFIYLLGNGFFGAMLMLSMIGFLSLGASALLAPGTHVTENLVAYMLLLAWGESFLTGFLLTMFTVYHPQWVFTFDDAVYLNKPTS
ncbi:energy-coupling factor ABC transporter permease [Noviherbaspirillum galbum]|uniref:Uncharacterized protein n=1 Tax=Noviherbaspirillum galbum TaxID=2709383 RepID=A0A6B3SUJ7_9BURK|nr:energy-coupling factor ABC transporter permease [Noviherbaspirillum galbum]NEX64387.1 hypothetical protein [Noviherbaspirillum galbum]